DRMLQERSRGRESLDRAVHAFATSGRGSMYQVLAGSRTLSWDDFRRDYVRGNRVEASVARAAPEPTTPMPERTESFLSPGVAPAKTLTVVFTGLTEGYLENCGCKGTQSGGLARRVSLVRKLRRSRPHVVLLDAGSTFSRTDKQPTLDTLSREELRFSLETIA